jgi:hypothetical protein
LIDAAVAVIEDRAREALTKNGRASYTDGYTEASVVATVLAEQGVLTHPDQDSKGWQAIDRVRKSRDGKAKRLLDAEAAKPNARILRFSSKKGDTPPRLTARRQGFYGTTVEYTTPELFDRAEELTAAAEAKAQADELALDNALEVAAALGLPAGRVRALTVTFTVEEFVALVERVQN